MTRKQSSGGKLSGCGQALGKSGPKTVQRGKTKRKRPTVAQKWPESSSVGGKSKRKRPSGGAVGVKWPEIVEQGAQNLCIHVKWGGNLGDFQGVVTLGVARDPKCIFPYRGEGFLEGVARSGGKRQDYVTRKHDYVTEKQDYVTRKHEYFTRKTRTAVG